ncbi:hypothetical protein AB0L40_10585 [Patulibacter sp. NPDC049589]|uniref:hypothetical protein n=1 Tax=Patulibacter sp. NPDC049589 TaxID=3154731 RepID=UPI003426D064
MPPVLTRLLAPRGLHPVLALAGGFVAVLLAQRLWIVDPGVEYGGGPIGWLARVAHSVNLLFHEAGHAILMPTGWEALILLGGTLLQLLVPMLLVGLAVRERRPGALVVVLMLLSASAYSAATYVADARDRALPLITGDSDSHDWGQLVYEIWRAPGVEDPIALVIRALGIAAFVAALAVCVLAGRRWGVDRRAEAVPRRLGPYGR